MAKSYYLPSDDAGKAAWLNNLVSKLPTYQAALGLSAADITSITADNAYFNFAFNAQQQIGAYAQQWTTYKNSAREGKTASLGTAPAAPNLGTAPTVVAPGIFIRVAALVARIKVAPGYTDSIGQALKIIGAEDSTNLATSKPDLSGDDKTGGKVELQFSKSKSDGVNLYGQRDGDATFVFLARDTQSPYVDNRPLLQAGKPEVRKYKAVYVSNDAEIGQFSTQVVVNCTP